VLRCSSPCCSARVSSASASSRAVGLEAFRGQEACLEGHDDARSSNEKHSSCSHPKRSRSAPRAIGCRPDRLRRQRGCHPVRFRAEILGFWFVLMIFCIFFPALKQPQGDAGPCRARETADPARLWSSSTQCSYFAASGDPRRCRSARMLLSLIRMRLPSSLVRWWRPVPFREVQPLIQYVRQDVRCARPSNFCHQIRLVDTVWLRERCPRALF